MRYRAAMTFLALVVTLVTAASCKSLPPDIHNPSASFVPPTQPGCRMLAYLVSRCLHERDDYHFFEGIFCSRGHRVAPHDACAQQQSCASFRKCWNRMEESIRQKGYPEERRLFSALMALPKPERWRRAFQYCGYNCSNCGVGVLPARLPADVVRRCRRIPFKLVEWLLDDIRRKRDRGDFGEKSVPVEKLRCYARWTDDKVRAVAQTLIDEIWVGRLWQRAEAEVAKQLASNDPRMPPSCALENLLAANGVATSYAQSHYRQLLELCFRKLGMKVMAHRSKSRSEYCKLRWVARGIAALRPRSPDVVQRLVDWQVRCNFADPPRPSGLPVKARAHTSGSDARR